MGGVVGEFRKHLSSEGRAPSFDGATGWLNSPPRRRTYATSTPARPGTSSIVSCTDASSSAA